MNELAAAKARVYEITYAAAFANLVTADIPGPPLKTVIGLEGERYAKAAHLIARAATELFHRR